MSHVVTRVQPTLIGTDSVGIFIAIALTIPITIITITTTTITIVATIVYYHSYP